MTRADYFQSLRRHVDLGRGEDERRGATQRCRPAAPAARPTSSVACGKYGGSQTGACWGNPAGGASALQHGRVPVARCVTYLDGRRRPRTCPASRRRMSAYVDDGVYLYHRLLDPSWRWPATGRSMMMLPIKRKGRARTTAASSTRDGDAVLRHPADRSRAASSTTSSRATRRPRMARRGSSSSQPSGPTSRTSSTRRCRRTATCVPRWRRSAARSRRSPATATWAAPRRPSAARPPGSRRRRRAAGTPSSCSSTQQNSAVLLDSRESRWGNQNLGDPNAPGTHVGTDIGNQITYARSSTRRRSCPARRSP